MQLMFFTERGYYPIPENEVLKQRSFFGLSNKLFRRRRREPGCSTSTSTRRFTAEELGFDGRDAQRASWHAVLPGRGDGRRSGGARARHQAREIVLLGNPLPVVANPLRLAEELAMIDLISKGRLVPGWVRGTGSEQLANNANPALNREYFDEGIDFIIKAWTTPGPFRFEGKHFHYRFVNPWVLPLQKPHPPIWIPG